MNETTTTKHGKTNGYKSNILRAKRHRRMLDAEARNVVYNGLSTKQKIELAKSRRGESKRELARLEARLATEKAPKAPSPTKEEKNTAKAKKAVKYGKDLAKSNLAV